MVLVEGLLVGGGGGVGIPTVSLFALTSLLVLAKSSTEICPGPSTSPKGKLWRKVKVSTTNT